MASTQHGYPYVTPDDHPKEYPAVSQALATKLETLTFVKGGIVQTTAAGGEIHFPHGLGRMPTFAVVSQWVTAAGDLTATVGIGPNSGATDLHVFVTVAGQPYSGAVNVAYIAGY